MVNVWSDLLDGILMSFSDVQLDGETANIDCINSVLKLPISFIGVVYRPKIGQLVDATV
jgi:hypothetical protein